MSNFDESLVIRDAAGQFGEKHHSGAEVTLPGAEAWRSTAYVGIDTIPDAPGTKFDQAQPGGYDEIWLNGDGHLRFFQRGKMHRSDGPALFGPDGEYEHWVDGHPVSPPQPDLILRSINEEGTQAWASASGKREAIRYRDGFEEHRQDGDLHRDGGPALAHDYGLGNWYQHGTMQESPIPDDPTYDGTGGATGSLFDEGRTPKAITKEVGSLFQTGRDAGMFHLGTDAEVAVSATRGQTPTITLTVSGMKDYRDRHGLLNVEAQQLMRHTQRQLMAFHQKRVAGETVTQNFVPIIEVVD